MFDLLAVVGSTVVGDIIKRVISAGIDWGRRRKKPPAGEIKRKVGEFVADAAKAASLPESLRAADRQRMISGIAELALPTFEQVVEYSPHTQRVVHAARTAAKKAAKKVVRTIAVKKVRAPKAAKKAPKRK